MGEKHFELPNLTELNQQDLPSGSLLITGQEPLIIHEKPSSLAPERMVGTITGGVIVGGLIYKAIQIVAERKKSNIPHIEALDKIRAEMPRSGEVPYTDPNVRWQLDPDMLVREGLEINAFTDSRGKRNIYAHTNNREQWVIRDTYPMILRNRFREVGYTNVQTYHYGKEGDPSDRILQKLYKAKSSIIDNSESMILASDLKEIEERLGNRYTFDERDVKLREYLDYITGAYQQIHTDKLREALQSERRQAFILGNSGNDARYALERLMLLLTAVYAQEYSNMEAFENEMLNPIIDYMTMNILQQQRVVEEIDYERRDRGKSGVAGMIVVLPAPFFYDNKTIELWRLSKNGKDKKFATFPFTEHLQYMGEVIMGATVIANSRALAALTKDYSDIATRFPIITIPLHNFPVIFGDGTYHYDIPGHFFITDEISKRTDIGDSSLLELHNQLSTDA